jgi:hypothetical protein
MTHRAVSVGHALSPANRSEPPEAIPAGDPQYEKAQRLLKVILAQSPH